MAGTQIQIEADAGEARRYIAGVLSALRKGGSQPGPLRDFYSQASARYLGFIRARFVRASRGDGTWKPLALYTKLKRLEKLQPARLRQLMKTTSATSREEQLIELANSRPFPILRDTGILFNSLTSGSPGGVQQFAQDEVTVGTNIKYAGYHQFGGTVPGHPPQRTILVPPDPKTEGEILQDLVNAMMAALEESTAVTPAATAA
jgi:phage gpG-like protein